jgi:hypothetical protein
VDVLLGMSKRDVLVSVTDTQWAAITGTPKVNRAAERRAHAEERARLCAALGYPTDCCATTGELSSEARSRGI